MRKSILAFILALSFCVPVFAAESQPTENNPQVLTVDEAVKRAINYSNRLKTLSENIEEAYDERVSTVDRFNRASEGYNIMDLSVSVRQIRNKIESYELNEKTEKISIEFSVKQFFADVIAAEKDLELYQTELELSNKELEIAELKLKLGLISQTEYDDTLSENKKINSNIVSRQSAIKNAYISLNTVLGEDLDTTYTLEYDVEFTPYEGLGLEPTLNKAFCTAQSLLSAQQDYDLKEYKLRNFTQIDPDASETRQQVRNSVSQAARSLADAKTDVEISVRNDYDNIIQSEIDYKNNLAQLSKLEKNLEILKLKYNMGKITELDLKKAAYDLESQKAQIKRQVYNYTLMVERFENPVLY